MGKPIPALLACIVTLALCACGDEPPLPEAGSLQAKPAVIDQMYGALPGSHGISTARDLALPGTGGERALSFNLYYPTAGKDYPLLLFSHGNWSDKDSYDRLIEHWVSHGYAVIAPDHLDCCGAVRGIFNSLVHGQVGLVQGRVADLRRLLAALPAIEQLHSDFAGKADPSRLAISGHSFGAFTAQQFGGARLFDPDSGNYLPAPNEAVRAVIALSPPGPMFDTITDKSWLTLASPTLVSTGTWDVQPRFWPDWRMHLMSWETALAGDKYALVVDGADHYLGNLICRTRRDAPPQEDALRMVQIATTTFLDAYVREIAQARNFLDSGALTRDSGGFASLSVR